MSSFVFTCMLLFSFLFSSFSDRSLFLTLRQHGLATSVFLGTCMVAFLPVSISFFLFLMVSYLLNFQCLGTFLSAILMTWRELKSQIFSQLSKTFYVLESLQRVSLNIHLIWTQLYLGNRSYHSVQPSLSVVKKYPKYFNFAGKPSPLTIWAWFNTSCTNYLVIPSQMPQVNPLYNSWIYWCLLHDWELWEFLPCMLCVALGGCCLYFIIIL